MAESLSTGKVVLIVLIVIFLPTILGVILAICLWPVSVIVPIVPQVTPVNQTFDTIPQTNPSPPDPGDGSVPIGISFGPAPPGEGRSSRALIPTGDYTKTSVLLTQKSETTALAENLAGGILTFADEIQHDQTRDYIFTFFWTVPSPSNYVGYNLKEDSVQSGSSGYSETGVTSKIPISSGRNMFSDMIIPFSVREKIRSRDTTLPPDVEIIETIMVFTVYTRDDAIAKGDVSFVDESGNVVVVNDDITYFQYIEWLDTINASGLQSLLGLSYTVETVIYNS